MLWSEAVHAACVPFYGIQIAFAGSRNTGVYSLGSKRVACARRGMAAACMHECGTAGGSRDSLQSAHTIGTSVKLSRPFDFVGGVEGLAME